MVKLNSVGSILDTKTFNVYPQNNDGTPDLDQSDLVSEWTELEDVDLGKLFYIHRQLVLELATRC